jgi:hypothetical protein
MLSWQGGVSGLIPCLICSRLSIPGHPFNPIEGTVLVTRLDRFKYYNALHLLMIDPALSGHCEVPQRLEADCQQCYLGCREVL